MKHWTEEELVERYYAGGSGPADAHLDECGECAGRLRAIESELSAVQPADVPERGEHYGEQMWARVEAALPPRKRAERHRLGIWRALGYAASCAVLLAGSFYGGRLYESRQHRGTSATASHVQAPAAPQPPKMVVVVLGDHLDRSERLLVELKHADAENPELVTPLRDEARNLIAANREFRDDAQREGDAALVEALGHLDKLLTEVANRPGGLDAAALTKIRDEMNADGLLFEVRVLRSQNPHRTKAVRVVARGGVA